MVKRAALGKGLGAILGDPGQINTPKEIAVKENPALISEIPLDMIVPNPYQPRTEFDQEALEELADSIRTLGIIQPLTLRKTAHDHYQIISGERRFRASKLAGLTSVPAYIRMADDTAMLEMAIVENIQRENLDAIETAMSFQRLIDECQLTQEAMAIRVGKKRATITNYLRLLKLPVEIQKALRIGKISAGHAKALLSLSSEEAQLSLCETIIKGDLSVRQTEDKARKMSSQQTKEDEDKESEPALPERWYKVAESVGKYFNDNIAIRRNAQGGGIMTVRFKDEAQMDNFLKAIEEKEL